MDYDFWEQARLLAEGVKGGWREGSDWATVAK